LTIRAGINGVSPPAGGAGRWRASCSSAGMSGLGPPQVMTAEVPHEHAYGKLNRAREKLP
jgi:hypothetical protein